MAKYVGLDSRVHNLEFAGSWHQLTAKEKNYAYYMEKAAWAASFCTMH